MARGNQGRPICAENADRKLWVAALAEACGRTGWRSHAWVLMGNHFHLLMVECGEVGARIVLEGILEIASCSI